MANTSLAQAKDAKNDEFYTELTEIQAEISNYIDKFKDKVVFCNCDDPFESNFVKYFLIYFFFSFFVSGIIQALPSHLNIL